MTDQNQNQEGQKTIVAFIVGLLIGGLIVWMFSGTESEAPVDVEQDTATTTEEVMDSEEDTEESNGDQANDSNGSQTTPEQPVMETGEGEVSVANQPASTSVTLDSVTYPMSDGWIGVRDYSNDRLGALLGVVRFSESEGLVPENIILQRSTEPGREYAIVFYTASDDNTFNLANNTQLEGVFATFTAQ